MDPIIVLVVDDEEDFLNALVTRLKLRDLKAHGVTTGEEALEFLEQQPVDVVVLDIKLPGMDGLKVLKHIKKKHSRIEVVMLTGHGETESGMEGLSLGAFAYLVKPVKLEELIAHIQEAHKWKIFDRRVPESDSDES